MAETSHSPMRTVIAVASVCVLAAVGIGIAIGVAIQNRETPATARRSSPSSATTSGGAPAPDDSPIDVRDIRWTGSHSVELPISASGPQNLTDDRSRGFERSRLGALLASIHIMSRAGTPGGPDSFEPTIREQVVGDRAKLLSVTQQDYEVARIKLGKPKRAALNRSFATWVGFQIRTYTSDTAAWNLLVAGPDGNGGVAHVDFRVEVRWSGEWKLLAPPEGDWSRVGTRVSDISAYAKFPGR